MDSWTCGPPTQPVFVVCVLPAQPALALQREGGLDPSPQDLVHQGLVLAVLSGPGGDPLPAQRAAESRFVHGLQEAALQTHRPGHGSGRSVHGTISDPLTLQNVCAHGSVTGSTRISRQTGHRQSSGESGGSVPPALSDIGTTLGQNLCGVLVLDGPGSGTDAGACTQSPDLVSLRARAREFGSLGG